jgi:hypothetical protein
MLVVTALSASAAAVAAGGAIGARIGRSTNRGVAAPGSD